MGIILTDTQKCKPENLKSVNPTTPQIEIDRDRLIVALQAALRLLREHGVKPKAMRGEK